MQHINLPNPCANKCWQGMIQWGPWTNDSSKTSAAPTATTQYTRKKGEKEEANSQDWLYDNHLHFLQFRESFPASLSTSSPMLRASSPHALCTFHGLTSMAGHLPFCYGNICAETIRGPTNLVAKMLRIFKKKKRLASGRKKKKAIHTQTRTQKQTNRKNRRTFCLLSFATHSAQMAVLRCVATHLNLVSRRMNPLEQHSENAQASETPL